MEPRCPAPTNIHQLHGKTGTYALILKCSHERRIELAKLGRMNVHKGCYVYVGSAFGYGGLLARLNHHGQISKSLHWHMDYLRPAVDITQVWYSLDPIKREHQWAGIFMETHGVKLPLKGFGSSDCKCESHLFFFNQAPSIQQFRKQIERAAPDHHLIDSLTYKKSAQFCRLIEA